MEKMLLWIFGSSLYLYSQNKQLWRDGKVLEGVKLLGTNWAIFPLAQKQMLTDSPAHCLSTSHSGEP